MLKNILHFVNITKKADNSALSPQLDTMSVFKKAIGRAAQGGIAGAAAMLINVCTLMWMRTVITYQYRYGTTTTVALKTLYKEGEILRFCRGFISALIQRPQSRFGGVYTVVFFFIAIYFNWYS